MEPDMTLSMRYLSMMMSPDFQSTQARGLYEICEGPEPPETAEPAPKKGKYFLEKEEIFASRFSVICEFYPLVAYISGK